MKIGILQTGHVPDEMRPRTGAYADLFQRFLAGRGFDFTCWDVVDMHFPDGVDAADGWLITGSKHGVYEDHAFIPPLEDFIRAAVAADKPVVGVCFGHQIIAQAMGGRVEKFKQGWSVGRTEYDWQGQPLALNAWHQDQVVELPPGADRVARTDFCENAALVYGDKAFSVQPHPEFESDFVAGLIAHRAPGVVPSDLVEAARAGLDAPNDNAALADMIARFFTERVAA